MFFRQLYRSLDCEFPASKFWHKLKVVAFIPSHSEASGSGCHVVLRRFVLLGYPSWRRNRLGLLVVVCRNPKKQPREERLLSFMERAYMLRASL